ncbi:MAG: BatA domain-containing protein [Planctomycetia bacterium]|nr:BatA domain-containing protein [Planctomycetia bacterium]
MSLYFRHPELLWWGWLCLVPVAIYWLLRRPPAQIPWAAMQFLRDAFRKTRFRSRVRECGLVALQTLFVATIVAALAVPVFHSGGGSQLFERNSTRTLFLLDASASMEASLPTRDVGLNDPQNSRPKTRRQAAEHYILRHARAEDTKLSAESLSAPNLAAALESQNYDRLVFVSDMNFAPQTLCREIQTLASKHPALRFELVSTFGLCDNVGILGAGFERSPLLANQKGSVWVDFSNQFSRALENVEVEVSLCPKGEMSAVFRVRDWLTLPQNSTTRVDFPCEFGEAGEYVLSVRLANVEDDFALDDTWEATFRVVQQARFLVAGTVSEETPPPPRSGPEYVEEALRAIYSQLLSEENPRKLSHSVSIEVARDPQFDKLDLDSYDAIILCDIPQITPAEFVALEAYVKKGGGCVFFVGDARIEAARYNAAEFLPARLAEFWRQEGETSCFPKIDDHAAPLLGTPAARFAPLESVPIQQAWRLEARENESAALISSSFGWSLVLEKRDAKKGEKIENRDGKIYMCAFSPGLESGALPLTHAFVPLMDRLILNACKKETPQPTEGTPRRDECENLNVCSFDETSFGEMMNQHKISEKTTLVRYDYHKETHSPHGSGFAKIILLVSLLLLTIETGISSKRAREK